MDPLRLSQIDEASISSLSSASIASDPIHETNSVRSYHPGRKSRLNSVASVPPPTAEASIKSGDHVPAHSSGFRRRTSTVTSWFRHQGSDDASLEPVSRKLTRQFTQQTAPGTSAFFVDGMLPNSVDDANEEAISTILNSEDSDNADSDDEERDNDLTKLNSIKKQVTHEVKQQLNKIGFFDPKFDRVKTMFHFVKGYFLITGVIMAIYSLYWGAMYHRTSRLKNFDFWVIVDEQDTLSQYVVEAANRVPNIGTWIPKPYQSISNDTSQLHSIMARKVYRQEIWGAVVVQPGAASDYLAALQSNSDFNTTGLMEVIHETGRDYVAESSYFTRAFAYLQQAFTELQPNMTAELTAQLSDSQKLAVLDKLLSPIMFTVTDLTPAHLLAPIVSGPQQFGLVYLHLLSLLQFAFFQPYHNKIASELKDASFIAYRLISSQITYIILGLGYTLVQVFFQIDIYTAYPHKVGFLIFWLSSYLVLSSLGGVNENISIFLQAVKPNLIPMWMFFWMVSNIAPTYYPISLSPKFYRYGYMMPIKNGYDLYKTLLFNTYKPANMPRNVCVLIGWVLITNALLPFTMMYYTKVKSEENKKKIKLLKKLKKLRAKHHVFRDNTVEEKPSPQ
ncbi:hypothetical protein OGAPHI_003024 [Ogataea philodendri]|uniref:DUF3533 domain-containing protein n=1 Tax=Ogataea philodendri TaxID=1378263 RepID=A0A9P8P9A8_9ASCO|nr:uncharacterized protein OGAPHI_003024 [Ogataea philodendri]KAH3667375.1 hypothetical protein OGAPHI_003024 [Ogataea philodendri]